MTTTTPSLRGLTINVAPNLSIRVAPGWFGRWRVYVTDARRTRWLATTRTPQLATALAEWFAKEVTGNL